LQAATASGTPALMFRPDLLAAQLRKSFGRAQADDSQLAGAPADILACRGQTKTG